MTSAPDPARWSRRTVLVAGTAVAGTALIGCTAPPTSRPPAGGPTPAPTAAGGGAASPAPAQPVPAFPGAVEAIRRQEAIVAHTATVLAVAHDELGAAGRRLIGRIRDQHLAHVASLSTPDPTDPTSTPPATPATPPTSPTPTSSPSGKKPTPAAALAQLRTAASTAAVAHRKAALTAEGLSALLWGSLATNAAATAGLLKAADPVGDDRDSGGAVVAEVAARAPMPVVSVVAAEQEMVRQLHAIVYGYQLALGRLTGDRRDRASAELRRHRILRDRLTARLLDRKADVPVAAAAYVPSTTPRNATTAAKLVRQLETALVPFCGLWLAAATSPTERAEALDQLSRTAAVSRQWGAVLTTWPGWTSV